MAPNSAWRASKRHKQLPHFVLSCQLLMSPVRLMAVLSFLRSTPLSLSLSFFIPPHPPSHLCVLSLCSQKEVSYQASLSVLLEKDERETDGNWEKAEKVWGEMRKRQGQREGMRKEAWIAAWLCRWDFLINVLTLLRNNCLAPCLSCRLTDWQACWLVSSLADGHRWRMAVYFLFWFGKDK